MLSRHPIDKIHYKQQRQLLHWQVQAETTALPFSLARGLNPTPVLCDDCLDDGQSETAPRDPDYARPVSPVKAVKDRQVFVRVPGLLHCQ